jgi:hypothetical protein
LYTNKGYTVFYTENTAKVKIMGRKRITIKMPSLLEMLQSSGSQNARDAFVRGNASGAHGKRMSKVNRRQNRLEEKNADSGIYPD